MGQFTGQNVANDLHVAVSMTAEAGVRLDPILVDDAQWTEFNVLRVEVIGAKARAALLWD